MSKRLLFVTSRLPWPQNSGRKVSLYHYCRGLHERYGYEIALFVFPEWDQPREAADKPAFISEVRFAAPIGKMTKLKNIVTRSIFGKKQPFQCSLYESAKNCKQLAALVADFAPDVMLFDMIRTAPYMKDYLGRVKCILDLDDLLSVRYHRQLAAFDDKAGIAGRYAGSMSPFFEKLLCHGRLGKWILRGEQKRLEKAELQYADLADGVILVSEKEAARLNEQLGHEKAVAVPTGVDIAAFAAAKDMKKSPRTFGFVGNLSVPANAASLDFTVRKILPCIKGDYCFEVVGYAPAELVARYKGHPSIHFCKEVDDLPAVLGKWQFTLCPIPFGSGLKTKVVEAMAAHLAVVTNPLGAEGITAQNGKELFICPDASTLASAANALLADPALARAVGNDAARFAASHFAWDICFAAFEKLSF